MANDFDQFPIDDPLTKVGTQYMSSAWQTFMGTFYENLIGYLTQYGMIIPNVTTAQRNDIQSPQEGQMIYTTNETPGPPRTAIIQVWVVENDVGAWRTVTTT